MVTFFIFDFRYERCDNNYVDGVVTSVFFLRNTVLEHIDFIILNKNNDNCIFEELEYIA